MRELKGWGIPTKMPRENPKKIIGMMGWDDNTHKNNKNKNKNCHMPQFFKIMLYYFDLIPRHYVKFNAKLKLMTQQSQKIWNVILNILFLNK